MSGVGGRTATTNALKDRYYLTSYNFYQVPSGTPTFTRAIVVGIARWEGGNGYGGALVKCTSDGTISVSNLGGTINCAGCCEFMLR